MSDTTAQDVAHRARRSMWAVVVLAVALMTLAGFTISGIVSWQSVDPRGATVQTGTGNREATDGCTTIEYRNDIPDEVVDLMRRQLDDGLEPLWHISGVETPIDDDRTGTPATWVTEPFRIVP